MEVKIKVVEVVKIVTITKKLVIKMRVIKKVNKVVIVLLSRIKIHGFINSTMKIVQNMIA